MSRIHYKEFKGISLLSRDLRNSQTPYEKKLWEVLRRKNLFGYKSLRQHPIFYRIDKNRVDFYIADFYCARLMLIIELDGSSHDGRDEYDQDRDEKLSGKGLAVFRFKNEESNNINNIIGEIRKIIQIQVRQLSNNKQDTSPALNFKGRGRG
jgi:leucyl-tRNA synthetase